MRARKQLEDTFQQIVCKLLPKMLPQDIRPAYQEQDNAGKDILNDNEEHSYVGFTPDDNFVYITVNIGTDNVITAIDSQGNVCTGYSVTATFSFYGNQSAPLSLCLYSLLKIPYAIEFLEGFGLYLLSEDSSIREMHEIINEQWYERHDFTLTYLQPDTITTPILPDKATCDSTNIKTIISVDNGVISEVEVKNVDK